MSGRRPNRKKNMAALKYCQDFSLNSCCTVGADIEIWDAFATMIQTSSIECRPREANIRRDPLAMLYCLGCDPRQPAYVRPTQWIDPGWPNPGDTSKNRDTTILVCKSWILDHFGGGSKPADPFYQHGEAFLAGKHSMYDQCGLLVSAPCLDGIGAVIPDRDRYMCGDDQLIPSVKYALPQHIVNGEGVTDVAKYAAQVEAVEAMINAESVGPFGMDDDFGLRIVNDVVENVLEDGTVVPTATKTPCTTEYLTKSYAAGDLNPRCLRTADQINIEKFSFPWRSARSRKRESAAYIRNRTTTWRDFYCSGGSFTGDSADPALTRCSAKLNVDGLCNEVDVAADPCCCAGWADEVCFSAARRPGASGLHPRLLGAAMLILALVEAVALGGG